MLEYTVVLDLVNEGKLLKCDLPGIPVAERDNIPYSKTYFRPL